MAKDQFKQKTVTKALTDRFSVMPLIERGEEFLCVDANFNFLMMKKERLEVMGILALPELVDAALKEQAQIAAAAHLPQDPAAVEKLINHLRNKGVDGFEEAYTKAMTN